MAVVRRWLSPIGGGVGHTTRWVFQFKCAYRLARQTGCPTGVLYVAAMFVLTRRQPLAMRRARFVGTCCGMNLTTN